MCPATAPSREHGLATAPPTRARTLGTPMILNGCAGAASGPSQPDRRPAGGSVGRPQAGTVAPGWHSRPRLAQSPQAGTVAPGWHSRPRLAQSPPGWHSRPRLAQSQRRCAARSVRMHTKPPRPGLCSRDRADHLARLTSRNRPGPFGSENVGRASRSAQRQAVPPGSPAPPITGPCAPSMIVVHHPRYPAPDGP